MERPVEYYLEWMQEFVRKIEAEREARKEDRARVVSEAFPECDQSKWLVKRATWEGMGVLQFKATYPQWREMFRASQDRYLKTLPDIDADDMNPVPPDIDYQI